MTSTSTPSMSNTITAFQISLQFAQETPRLLARADGDAHAAGDLVAAVADQDAAPRAARRGPRWRARRLHQHEIAVLS